MNVYLHTIGTLLPPNVYHQPYARDRMTRWIPGRRNERMIRGIYDHSGIDTRYSVLPDFVPGRAPVLFKEGTDGRIIEPTTGARNDVYIKHAKQLSVDAARQALVASRQFHAADVTHVITVTCTGFSNPGPDLQIVRELGIADTAERYQLGFMGCYAAFPALRMAAQFCQARPDSVVLVVAVELCSLHLQMREETDSLVANSLFADGAAAAVVSARKPAAGAKALAIHGFSSAIAAEGMSDMAWTIGDHGFDIRLSTYVPGIIAANVQAIVARSMASSPWSPADIGVWAIHPGGRSILDKVEQTLALAPEQIADAREVLRQYGNMSSATILFVLKRLMESASPLSDKPIYAMGFGPGLTVETALFEPIHVNSLASTEKELRDEACLVV